MLKHLVLFTIVDKYKTENIYLALLCITCDGRQAAITLKLSWEEGVMREGVSGRF